MEESVEVYAEPELLIETKLFNEYAKNETQLINGESTGISNLNNIKYEWSKSLYRQMVGNFWLPEKVSLTEDKITISELTEDELNAVQNTLSFLIFLDSFQANNIPNIRRYITDPAVANLLTIQEFQEVIHSQSYQYLLEGLFPSFQRDAIYNRWKDDEILKNRNKYIASIAETFVDNPTFDNFVDVIAANYALEGIYFYQGFYFFYQLAFRSKLVQSAKMINYIENDELTHMGIFINIIKELNLSGTPKYRDRIVDILKTAAEHEIAWSNHIYGNKILGINAESSEQFIKYLVNDRLSRIRISPVYESKENPYQYLSGAKKENFFENTVTEYSKAETIIGWDF